MKKILIIEDNIDVNKMLVEVLNNEGYLAESAFTGLEGLQNLKTKQYDLVLLDIMLPYKSGDEVLKELRHFSLIPVIIISSKDMVSTKIALLKLGADDYITKPFDLQEVVARVEANLRRSQLIELKILTYKDLKLDKDNKQVLISGIIADLTAKEYLLIEMFLDNPKKVFTKENIYNTVWNEEYIGDDNVVKTHISNLRNKLKKINPDLEYIETVWGLGYRLLQ